MTKAAAGLISYHKNPRKILLYYINLGLMSIIKLFYIVLILILNKIYFNNHILRGFRLFFSLLAKIDIIKF
jgi:hypothetical protein